jgi:hypothetical protein
VNPAVHRALHIGLCNDQRFRFFQEFPDFRRDLNEFRTAAQHANFRIGEKAEAGALVGRELTFFNAALELVFPHAEEDEVVFLHPFQEMDGFP